MKKKVIALMSGRLGEPVRSTKKVQAWNITSNFDVVVQVDGQGDDAALVWLPMVDSSITSLPLDKRVYAPGEGRHSNTYASPGLGKGEAAIRLNLRSDKDIETLGDYLFARF